MATTNFFIGIGGSGAKVLESLTHLCAMGLMPGNEDLYVLGIDPDHGNGNLNRAKAVYDRYRNLVNKDWGLQLGKTPLFKTRTSNSDDYYFNPVESGNAEFKEEMRVSGYNEQDPVRKLFELLYTSEERSTKLGEGFRGHPNIGAAVLAKNLTEKSEGVSFKAWTAFIEKIKSEAGNGQNTVKIFLAGSIFGGTGAAGVPNIAKLLRNILEKGNRSALGVEASKDKDKSNIIIGGALVLPYFAVPDSYKDEVANRKEGICVTSEDFLPNTQAALNYYSVAMLDVYNSIYLIGSEECSKEIGLAEKGGEKQKNDAHVVDLYSAMAALDFYGRTPNTISTAKCYYSCYGSSNEESPKVRLADLPFPGHDLGTAQAKFVQMLRFAMYYHNQVRFELPELKAGKKKSGFLGIFGGNGPTWYKKFQKEGENFELTDRAYTSFNDYIDYLLEWAYQLANCDSADLIDPILFNKTPDGIDINYERVNDIGICKQIMDMAEIDHCFNQYEYNDEYTDEERAAGAVKEAHKFGKLLRVLYDSCAAPVSE